MTAVLLLKRQTGKDMGKVIQREKIEELLKLLRSQNKVIVATNGCFDILHVGHVRYLKKSKSFGDVLIVGLNSDKSVRSINGEVRPLNYEQDRTEVLCALESVDYVVLFDEDSPKDLLEVIKPNIYTKGADYTLKTLPEADVILRNNGWVEFIDFVEGKSTTKIIDKIK